MSISYLHHVFFRDVEEENWDGRWLMVWGVHLSFFLYSSRAFSKSFFGCHRARNHRHIIIRRRRPSIAILAEFSLYLRERILLYNRPPLLFALTLFFTFDFHFFSFSKTTTRNRALPLHLLLLFPFLLTLLADILLLFMLFILYRFYLVYNSSLKLYSFYGFSLDSIECLCLKRKGI